MSKIKNIVAGMVRKPPMLFPLIGLFHLVNLLWVVWSDRHVPFNNIEWLQALWLLGFTVCWLAACGLRKWGALGYILLSAIDIVLFLSLKDKYQKDLYVSNIVLYDGLFSFFLLVYYKRFG